MPIKQLGKGDEHRTRCEDEVPCLEVHLRSLSHWFYKGTKALQCAFGVRGGKKPHFCVTVLHQRASKWLSTPFKPVLQSGEVLVDALGIDEQRTDSVKAHVTLAMAPKPFLRTLLYALDFLLYFLAEAPSNLNHDRPI